jgi:hypothetical protein
MPRVRDKIKEDMPDEPSGTRVCMEVMTLKCCVLLPCALN